LRKEFVMTDVIPPAVRDCGTADEHRRLLLSVPGYAEARAQSENNAWAAARRAPVARSGVTTVPVVVHVVWNTPDQNISDDQVRSQIDVLNHDFRKKNVDSAQAPAPFLAVADDARIEFALATLDPAGDPTTGITRTVTAQTSFAQNDGVKSSNTGGADGWPRDNYLNLWVCPLARPLLGYATFPGGPAELDGVVILHSAFGTTGTVASPFDLGRTATHEIGHWLNLHHINGDDGTGCNGTDFVDDTPNQAGLNTGKPTFPHVTCNNGPDGDMFMNYMDYVDDAAMVMFSQGQVVRMQTSLDNDRPSIGFAQPQFGWHHADLTASAQGPDTTGRPFGYAFDGQGTQHVVHSAGGHVAELWWESGTGWHVNDLTATAPAPLAAGDPSAYMFDAQCTQHVVFRAADDSVNELWWERSDGWHLADLTKVAHAAPAAGDPAGYLFEAQATQHVVYTGTGRHVYELWWERNSGWNVSDLTAATGAPAAAGNPHGYVFDAQGTQHVVYRGDDGHIVELWWQATDGWHLTDLTTVTGAAAAAGDPTGYMFDAQGTQHVLYRSVDGHVVELWWQAADGWHLTDLTAATGAPAAAGEPAAYMFNAQVTQHVVHRTADGHVVELWWQATDGWHLHDLTATTGAPPAATDPTGYLLDAQATQHIVYGGADGHVHELWWG
jgi:uncharacterized protein YjhX (UPF0386 family)